MQGYRRISIRVCMVMQCINPCLLSCQQSQKLELIVLMQCKIKRQIYIEEEYIDYFDRYSPWLKSLINQFLCQTFFTLGFPYWPLIGYILYNHTYQPYTSIRHCKIYPFYTSNERLQRFLYGFYCFYSKICDFKVKNQ